jgi:tetratricopeptide (TPR) repeat protein
VKELKKNIDIAFIISAQNLMKKKLRRLLPKPHFNRYRSGFYEEAVEEYRRAIKVAPNFAPLYRNMAVMESMENHVTDASTLMSKASELDPTDPQIYLLWGNIFRKSSKHFEADKKYSAHSLAPNDPVILSAYGQSTSHLGFYQDADNLLKELMNAGSNFPSLKHIIINRTSIAENNIEWGESLIEKRDYEMARLKFIEAIQTCKELINGNATDQKVLSTMYKANFKYALLFFMLHQDDEAILRLEITINSEVKSFKHAKYRLSALIEICEFFTKNHDREKVKLYLDLIDTDYKYSPLLSQDYRNQQQRLNLLREYLNPTQQLHGIIRNGNIERKFVIIEELNSNLTYLAYQQSFVQKLTMIPSTFKGQKVLFSPSFVVKDGVKQGKAINVKVLDF